jgi:hypothetical protein
MLLDGVSTGAAAATVHLLVVSLAMPKLVATYGLLDSRDLHKIFVGLHYIDFFDDDRLIL